MFLSRKKDNLSTVAPPLCLLSLLLLINFTDKCEQGINPRFSIRKSFLFLFWMLGGTLIGGQTKTKSMTFRLLLEQIFIRLSLQVNIRISCCFLLVSFIPNIRAKRDHGRKVEGSMWFGQEKLRAEGLPSLGVIAKLEEQFMRSFKFTVSLSEKMFSNQINTGRACESEGCVCDVNFWSYVYA